MTRRPRSVSAGLLALTAAACAAIGAPASAAADPAPSAGPSSWMVYHGNPDGNGAVTGVSSVDSGARAWTSPTPWLHGEIYGEPLVFGGRVYVATEEDTVFAVSRSAAARPTTAPRPTPTRRPTLLPLPTGGGFGHSGTEDIVLGSLVVIGGIGWVLWRRGRFGKN